MRSLIALLALLALGLSGCSNQDAAPPAKTEDGRVIDKRRAERAQEGMTEGGPSSGMGGPESRGGAGPR